MAMKPKTEDFHEMIIEVEKDAEKAPGIYTKICGMTSNAMNRAHNMNETEVPADCEDESLPSEVVLDIQSSTVSLSGSGVWAAQSSGFMKTWWYDRKKYNVQVTHAKALPGDVEIERGPAYLVTLNDSRETGQKVSAEIEIRFDGLPERVMKATGTSAS